MNLLYQLLALPVIELPLNAKICPLYSCLSLPPFLSSECMQVYVLGYNIYLLDVANESVTTVTTDGRENGVSNGVPDWVYEGTY